MTGILAIGAGLLLLLLAHAAAAVGLDRRAFSMCEAFVAGHWPFVWLGATLLVLTGGQDWARLDGFSGRAIATAVVSVCLGLAAFLVASWLAALLRDNGVIRRQRQSAPVSSIIAAGCFMVVVGGWASASNATLSAQLGMGYRVNALIAISQLLVPGAVFAFAVTIDRRARVLLRLAAGVAFLTALSLMTLEWSRRYTIVTVGAVLLLMAARRWHVPRRSLLIAAFPVFAVLAVGGLVWRQVFAQGVSVYGVMSTGILQRYVDALWLEASSFSGLVVVLEERGPWVAQGPGSLLAAFVFWIPRSLWPAKPEGFDLAQTIGTQYSVPATIYGEIVADVTILGIIPILFAMGFLFKGLDLAYRDRTMPTGMEVAYTILVVDALFLVRGAFQAMVVPMIIHFVGPLVILELIGGMRGIASLVQESALRSRPTGK